MSVVKKHSILQINFIPRDSYIEGLFSPRTRQRMRNAYHKRRAIKQANSWDDSAKRFKLAKKCVVCKATDNLTVDHILPLSRGGGHVYKRFDNFV